jgi:predicted dehydrogenase
MPSSPSSRVGTAEAVGAASSSDGTARIGVIGAGYWAVNFYLPFLARHPHAVCVGVVRPGTRELRALKRRFDLSVATEDVDDLLGLSCDGVIVASPHWLHAEHAIRALEAGMHVLVEKPMALTRRDAEAVAAAAAKTGLGLTVAHGFNYLPMSTWAIDLVRSGRLGRPLSLVAYMASAIGALLAGDSGYGQIELEGVTFEADPRTWSDRERGGGYLYGQISHLLALGLAFVDAHPTSAFARTRSLPNGVDIDVNVSVGFDDGAIASFSGSGQLPWGVRYPLDLRLIAEEGVLNLDYERERADAFLGKSATPESFMSHGEEAFAGRAPELSFAAAPGDGLYTCAGPVEYLIARCLERETVNRAPVELGSRAVAILEAAASSARTQEAIFL